MVKKVIAGLQLPRKDWDSQSGQKCENKLQVLSGTCTGSTVTPRNSHILQTVSHSWIHQSLGAWRQTINYTSESSRDFLQVMDIPPPSLTSQLSHLTHPQRICIHLDCLKRALGSRRPRTIAGLWKACKQGWERIDMHVLRRSLFQWKLLCRTIVRSQGHQIDHRRFWFHGL